MKSTHPPYWFLICTIVHSLYLPKYITNSKNFLKLVKGVCNWKEITYNYNYYYHYYYIISNYASLMGLAIKTPKRRHGVFIVNLNRLYLLLWYFQCLLLIGDTSDCVEKVYNNIFLTFFLTFFLTLSSYWRYN